MEVSNYEITPEQKKARQLDATITTQNYCWDQNQDKPQCRKLGHSSPNPINRDDRITLRIVTGITSPNVSLRGVSDEAIAWHGQEIASQSLAMTCSGKWGRYSGYDPYTKGINKTSTIDIEDR
ncbi:MAG: hypothetical protein GY774_26600 [Planctomycetes bacterium]|nr:hypothetical protein [Planctomycetota bacterium]